MPKRPPVFRPPGFRRTKRAPEKRASARARGYDYAWEEFSKAYLREHPLCVQCLAKAKTVPSTQTDHIVPLSKGGEKYVASNLQALCDSHHSRKTRRGE
jgi:5-methylcytosine-specific restriction protein A